MKKYVLLYLIGMQFLIPSSNAQTTLNAGAININNNYGSITASIGEIFYVNNGQEFSIEEGIQNSILPVRDPNFSIIKIDIYPNPTNGSLYFKTDHFYNANLTYSIFNTSGHLVLNGVIFNNYVENSLSNLPAAIYYIKIQSNQDVIMTKKVIKIN
jgi:hypothetical protein